MEKTTFAPESEQLHALSDMWLEDLEDRWKRFGRPMKQEFQHRPDRCPSHPMSKKINAAAKRQPFMKRLHGHKEKAAIALQMSQLKEDWMDARLHARSKEAKRIMKLMRELLSAQPTGMKSQAQKWEEKRLKAKRFEAQKKEWLGALAARNRAREKRTRAQMAAAKLAEQRENERRLAAQEERDRRQAEKAAAVEAERAARVAKEKEIQRIVLLFKGGQMEEATFMKTLEGLGVDWGVYEPKLDKRDRRLEEQRQRFEATSNAKQGGADWRMQRRKDLIAMVVEQRRVAFEQKMDNIQRQQRAQEYQRQQAGLKAQEKMDKLDALAKMQAEMRVKQAQIREEEMLVRQQSDADMAKKRLFAGPGPGEYDVRDGFRFTSTHGGRFPHHMRMD